VTTSSPYRESVTVTIGMRNLLDRLSDTSGRSKSKIIERALMRALNVDRDGKRVTR
jgi:hypothetical protein